MRPLTDPRYEVRASDLVVVLKFDRRISGRPPVGLAERLDVFQQIAQGLAANRHPGRVIELVSFGRRGRMIEHEWHLLAG